MMLWIVTLLVLSASCLAEAHTDSPVFGTEISGNIPERRMIRSPVLLGKAAIEWVLNGAKFLYTNGVDNLYIKKGNFKTAMRDFDKINANGRISRDEKALMLRHKLKGQMIGRNGDFVLVLNKNKQTGHTTLSLSEFPPTTGLPSTIVSKIILYAD